MWRTIVLAIVAIVLAGNGLHMLLAPEHWYHSLESVPHTGPFNPHFVRDIGCAYLAAALGAAWGIRRPAWIVPTVAVALAFIGAHAGVHLWELASGVDNGEHFGLVDALGVFGPAILLAIVLVTPPRTSAN
jgi:hypothetical protein